MYYYLTKEPSHCELIADFLHIDDKTYRRIEKDKAIPRIDLLENMSLIFKEDLVLSFVKYNSQGMEMLEKIKEDLDRKIIESDFDKLNENIPRLTTLINTIKNPYYTQQYKQYIFLIEGTVVYNEGINYYKSIEISTEGILISNEKFSIDRYKSFIYSNLECRLLMNIAFSFYRLGDQEKYFEIFDFIMGEVDHNDDIYPIVAYNLGTAYKRLEKYSNAIKLMAKGIKYCEKKSNNSMLPLLYYGKGVSEYYLNHYKYKNSFKKAVSLAGLLGYNDLKISITEKCKNNFQYNVSEEIETFFNK